MSNSIPHVPAGSGKHPIFMVAVSANNLAASTDFYRRLFGWQTMNVSSEVTACIALSGPTISLRANTPDGFQGAVPFIRVDKIDAALAEVVAAGGAIERAPWKIPAIGQFARFADPSGTIYGVTDAAQPMPMPSVPIPFADNPRPPAGTICSIEMYATSGAAAAAFYGKQFGWGCAETIPGYMAFDPGAGVGGVFQSHTPTLAGLAYVYVADVGATLIAIDAAGGERVGDAMSMPGLATFGYFKDPSGTTMGLIGP